MSKIILLISLFTFPLLRPVNNFGYEQVKVLFFILSITLIGVFWKGRGIRWTLISRAAGLFLFILLITSILGINPKNSLLGNQPYFQGWIFYLYLFLFYLMIKTFKIDLKKYALILSISAFLVSLLAIKDWVLLNLFHQQVLTYAGRVVSTFGQPNFYAGFLLFTMPFSYLMFKNKNRRLSFLGMVGILFSLVGIFISYSRSTILIGLILLILGLIDQLKTKVKLVLAVFLILFASVLLAFSLSSGIVGSELNNPTSTNNPNLVKESVEKRIYLWPQLLLIGQQKLLTGFGLENISLSYAGYFEKNKHSLFEENLHISPVLISLKELIIDRSHNYFIDLLLFSGLLGLISWIFLMCVIFLKLSKYYYNQNRNILIVSFITYICWVQFQNQSVVHLVYFWLLVGLIDQAVT